MLFISLLLSFFSVVFSCQIAGKESGSCVALSNVATQIPFCSETLSGYICVPEAHELWPTTDIKYTDQNVTSIEYRDQQIQQKFMTKIVSTFLNEANVKEAKDMYLITNKDCFTLYKQFVCNWNFPSCDSSTGITKPVCMQLCLDYHSNCGLHSQLCNVNYDAAPALDDTNSDCSGIGLISL